MFIYHVSLAAYSQQPTCYHLTAFYISISLYLLGGSGISAGIANDYGLDGPGIESRSGEIFRPSRPALGHTQPPIQQVPGLSRGKVRPGRAADHSSPSSAAVMEE